MNRSAIVSINNSQIMKRVAAIKGIRRLTLWSLRETVEFCRNLEHGPEILHAVPDLEDNEITEILDRINNSGHNITLLNADTPSRREIKAGLESILSYATLAGENDIVRAISLMIKTYLSFVEDDQNTQK